MHSFFDYFGGGAGEASSSLGFIKGLEFMWGLGFI